jgi:hypothetical protein
MSEIISLWLDIGQTPPAFFQGPGNPRLTACWRSRVVRARPTGVGRRRSDAICEDGSSAERLRVDDEGPGPLPGAQLEPGDLAESNGRNSEKRTANMSAANYNCRHSSSTGSRRTEFLVGTTTNDPARICRWGRTLRSRGRFSPSAPVRSWRFLRSAVCTIGTNESPLCSLPTFSPSKPRRSPCPARPRDSIHSAWRSRVPMRLWPEANPIFTRVEAVPCALMKFSVGRPDFNSPWNATEACSRSAPVSASA